MNKVKEEKYKILKKFSDICKQNNLWWSLDSHSLLALFSENNLLEELDHFDVMMDIFSYSKLKNIVPELILDSTLHSDYYSLQNKFLENPNNFYEEQSFININLIIPTKLKKVKQYIKFSNRYKSFVNYYATLSSSNVGKLNNKINLSKLLKKHTKLITYKDIVNSLFDDAHEGFIITEPIIKKSSTNKWISNVSYKISDDKIQDIDIKYINEYDQYLINIYGEKYKKISSIFNNLMFVNPVDIVKYNQSDAFEDLENKEND
ncbi:hypothetical protein AB5V95_02205 [Metamycoplasma spumans]|uniref:hypothetical protein n=1 Tax=Metamycoplasma spumans TaxID=92406 RepID=UPI0034DD950D